MVHGHDTGVAIQACMAGIVFAKLARPKKRARTVTFSKIAVVSLVNGKLRDEEIGPKIIVSRVNEIDSLAF